jgi:hypothetical protein
VTGKTILSLPQPFQRFIGDLPQGSRGSFDDAMTRIMRLRPRVKAILKNVKSKK